MRRIIRNFRTWAPGFVAVAIIVFKLLAGSVAYSSAPASPDPSTGHIVPVFSHGKTVYLTQAQVEREGVFHWSNFVLVGAVAVVVVQASGKARGVGKNGA
jgi:hypothetical protein